MQGGGAFFDKGHAPVTLNEQLAVVGVGLQRVRSGTVEGCNRGDQCSDNDDDGHNDNDVQLRN